MVKKIAVSLKWTFVVLALLFAACETAAMLPGAASPATKFVFAMVCSVGLYSAVAWLTRRRTKPQQRLLTYRPSGLSVAAPVPPRGTTRSLIVGGQK